MKCLRFGLKIASLGFTVTEKGQSFVAAIFADRKHIISPCGYRQVDGTRNPHEKSRNNNMARNLNA